MGRWSSTDHFSVSVKRMGSVRGCLAWEANDVDGVESAGKAGLVLLSLGPAQRSVGTSTCEEERT